MVYKFEVKELKTRLDKFLVGALPEFSRAKVQQDIASGQVRVNEQIVLQAKFQVCPGDLVTFTPSEKVDKNLPKDLPVKVLFENDDLLILDKPAGISVHPGAGFKGDSLTQMLLFRYPSIQGVGEAHRPGIVHRLDKETSGWLLVVLPLLLQKY
jgi:23S rRNA pseudouridine1911/1915/1917 synthase